MAHAINRQLFTSEVLDGGGWSASCPNHFTPEEKRVPGTLWRGGRVGPNAGLDTVAKRKQSLHCSYR